MLRLAAQPAECIIPCVMRQPVRIAERTGAPAPWGEASQADAPGCYPGCCWFKSSRPSHSEDIK